MKPQTGAFLERARDLVARAPALLADGYVEEAARAAYMAGFHAAQAMLFEREDRVFKTHGGVQSEFHKAVRNDPRFDADLRGFLARTYQLKATADYGTGPDAIVSDAQAAVALAAARLFVEAVEILIAS